MMMCLSFGSNVQVKMMRENIVEVNCIVTLRRYSTITIAQFQFATVSTFHNTLKMQYKMNINENEQIQNIPPLADKLILVQMSEIKTFLFRSFVGLIEKLTGLRKQPPMLPNVNYWSKTDRYFLGTNDCTVSLKRCDECGETINF